MSISPPAPLQLLWPEISGHALPALASRAGRETHVYAVSLNPKPGAIETLAGTLSRAELERAARFHFERDRRRFTVCRGSLRALLGKLLGIAAHEVEFAYGPNGKPALAPPLAESGIQFNVSHSEEVALIALALDVQVGVDVEHVRVLKDAAELVARFFSDRENTAFQLLAADSQAEAFFNLWTRKEAWLKATGEGIAHRLNQVEVSFLPGETAELVRLPSDLGLQVCWNLRSLSPVCGYTGALVTGSPKQRDVGSPKGEDKQNPLEAELFVRCFSFRGTDWGAEPADRTSEKTVSL